MFNIVPSNRQEYLLQVLIALLKDDYQSGKLGVFEQSSIMVESLGMKHYIHMGIAAHSQIAMNIDFPLVSRCIYALCRNILGDDAVPTESLYKREILVWRIESILRTTDFIDNPKAQAANDYWQASRDPEKSRFLLAQSTADVFEQYMQFRPEWFAMWEQEQSVLNNPDDSNQQALEPWQALIWRHLVSTQATHPASIITRATQEFEPNKADLPKVLYIFAVNALSPQQLAFLKVISQQVDIYLFHLNPCVEYWGDLISEKALMHEALKKGMNHLLDESSPNALLANLGKQGRVLFNQLQDIEYPDFTNKQLFVGTDSHHHQNVSLLNALQQDLLHATTGSVGAMPPDNSISIHSCHSALREIQVLHDYLLHIIENDVDAAIKPHDIIVLCPAVEEYAPYVKSVFRGIYDKQQAGNPQLVCSIADRAPLDADPIVGMVMDMLNLPDSRFSVSSLIDYLHIDSVQQRFNLSQAELSLCEQWIADANIYWGKDADHKRVMLGLTPDDALGTVDIYTWEWGLARLLKSALHADNPAHPLAFSITHSVEGQDMRTLGKLILFIETLQTIFTELTRPRTMIDWLSYIRTDIVDTLFANDANSRTLNTLKRMIEQVHGNVLKAEHAHLVPLQVARESLDSVLSKPDPINQFNTGQVTFSSMIPMRSVPFKVVCMLGLNDGVFPRSANPLSIDLMVNEPVRNTDRSRRNEDRYLFLEAIISARNYLYLSYQGNSIKNNAQREPSLVLREFEHHIKRAFELELTNRHPLQAFSQHAFEATTMAHDNWSKRPSFSQSWLTLSQTKPLPSKDFAATFELPQRIFDDALLQFFVDPLAAYCKHHFQLSFDTFMDAQSDIEPFDINGLSRHTLLSSMVLASQNDQAANFEETLNDMVSSGELPQLDNYRALYIGTFEHLQSQDIDFERFQHPQKMRDYRTSLDINIDGTMHSVELLCTMQVDEHADTDLLLSSAVKQSSVFSLLIQHAIKRLALQTPTSSSLSYLDMKGFVSKMGKYQAGQIDDAPSISLQEVRFDDENFSLDNARAFLKTLIEQFYRGMQSPTFLHVDLGVSLNQAVGKIRDIETSPRYSDIGNIDEVLNGTLKNERFVTPYFRYLYPDLIDASQVDLTALEAIYYSHLPSGWEL